MSHAQTIADPSDVLFTDLALRAELGTDCNTRLLITSSVNNVGSAPIESFELRIDVRGLNINNATVNGTLAQVESINIENYIMLAITPLNPIGVAESARLYLNITTQCLQERVGLNPEGTMYLSHLIYYFRPVSQVNNLTFTAVLPPHAVLQTESTAPLFPEPTGNHTDGTGLVFVWQSNQLLPGQEMAYIVKYQMPASLLQTTSNGEINVILIVGASALVGGAIVLFLGQMPRIIKEVRTFRTIKDSNLSDDEQMILEFIAKRGGSCSQREIYEALDMSQSMASMILTSLEQRGVVKRLKSGRENIVHIIEE